MSAQRQPFEPDAPANDPCPDPLIVGAEQIAAYLGIKIRQAYALREKGIIGNVPGLGLAARRSVLDNIGR